MLNRLATFRWNVSSGRMYWSDDVYRMLGYDNSLSASIDLLIQRIHYDDIAVFGQALDAALQGCRDIETTQRLLMPDGSIRHTCMQGHATSSQPGSIHYVGSLADMTLVEDMAISGPQIREELAHLTRALARAQLDAAILREVHQPLCAMVANSEAALRWLERESPDLDEARSAVSGLVDECRRVGAMISRLQPS
jgi:hypothetical protein